MDTEASQPADQQAPPGAVVVGVDGSADDHAVLTAAVVVATRRGDPLHVRHCQEQLDPYLSFGSGGLMYRPDAVGEPDRVLDAARQIVAELAPELPTTYDRAFGRPENQLVASSETASLLVVGTGRKSGMEQFLLGAVALNVAAHARCPVLVVPRGTDPNGAGEVAVGVDGSSHSRQALVEAIRLARVRESKLVVITTWLIEAVDGYIVTEPDTDEWRRIEDRIRRQQQKMLDACDTNGVEVELRPVHGGIRATLAEASKDAAVLVVGNRGRGGFLGKTLGSVTMDLLKRAQCPVLVVGDRR